jgi:hypothetical protein
MMPAIGGAMNREQPLRTRVDAIIPHAFASLAAEP